MSLPVQCAERHCPRHLAVSVTSDTAQSPLLKGAFPLQLSLQHLLPMSHPFFSQQSPSTMVLSHEPNLDTVEMLNTFTILMVAQKGTKRGIGGRAAF